MTAPAGSESRSLCDGCNVREPFEHRCHGAPCPCEECREADRLFGSPAGSEDAGLVLSAEDVEALAALLWRSQPKFRSVQAAEETAAAVAGFLGGIIAARVEAARAEAGQSIRNYSDAHDFTAPQMTGARVMLDVLDLVARIARTPPPAGDAQRSQEARNGPQGDGDAGDGRDDESGKGAGL